MSRAKTYKSTQILLVCYRSSLREHFHIGFP